MENNDEHLREDRFFYIYSYSNDDHALKGGLNALARLNMQKSDEIPRLEAEREILKQRQMREIRQFEAEH